MYISAIIEPSILWEQKHLDRLIQTLLSHHNSNWRVRWGSPTAYTSDVSVIQQNDKKRKWQWIWCCADSNICTQDIKDGRIWLKHCIACILPDIRIIIWFVISENNSFCVTIKMFSFILLYYLNHDDVTKHFFTSKEPDFRPGHLCSTTVLLYNIAVYLHLKKLQRLRFGYCIILAMLQFTVQSY